jgi:alanine racemase
MAWPAMELERETTKATRAVIDLSAVGHNISEIRKKIGVKRRLMAVVKADGYGHGSLKVSTAALKNGADCLGVAFPEEALPLREAGIDVPIAVLGLIRPEESNKVADLALEQTICSMDLAEALDHAARNAGIKINVHVKVDTGMGRIGVLPGDALEFVRKVSRLENLRVKGIFSHFACSDEEDSAFTEHQINIFERVTREIESSGVHIPQKHMANSGGVLAYPASYYDMVRPGIMIYGLYPSAEVPRSVNLIPAMSLKSRVTQLKKVPPKTPVSYGRTYYTRRNTVVATIPIGYADGYNRRLSNKAYANIGGKKASLIGRVCMDMSMFDVSEFKNIREGDEAILFGSSPTIDEIAASLGTINYEIVCAVGKRVPRVYEETATYTD